MLSNLRAENRLWWSGSREELTHPVKQAFRDAFIPPDERWREKVLKQGRMLVEKVLTLGSNLLRVPPCLRGEKEELHGGTEDTKTSTGSQKRSLD